MAVIRSYFVCFLVLAVVAQLAFATHQSNGTGKSRTRTRTSVNKKPSSSSRLRSAAVPVSSVASDDDFDKLMIESNDFDDLFNELDVMGGGMAPQRPSAVLPPMDIDDPFAAEYEDLLFDEYDNLPMFPVVDSSSNVSSNSTISKYLTSEV